MNGENMIINTREVHPTLLKVVVVCALALGALVGFATWKHLTASGATTATVTPSVSVAKVHNYDLKEGIDYGYTVLVTEDQRKAGQAGAQIIMMSYAGERNGKHQVHSRQGGLLTAYECSAPCDIVKIVSAMDIDGLRRTVHVERLRASPNMIASLALQDAMTGKLQTYSEYPEAAPKGTRLDVWIDEQKGIIRTARKM